MPRIYTSQSDPLDFHKRCFPSEEEARELYANLGDGPDERGNCFSYDDEAPYFFDDPDHGYECEKCGKGIKNKKSY